MLNDTEGQIKVNLALLKDIKAKIWDIKAEIKVKLGLLKDNKP